MLVVNVSDIMDFKNIKYFIAKMHGRNSSSYYFLSGIKRKIIKGESG
jgi:hypothetical protein